MMYFAVIETPTGIVAVRRPIVFTLAFVTTDARNFLRVVRFALWLSFLVLEVGCASYPRFPAESSVTANQLLRELGTDASISVLGPDVLRGNTLRSEHKMFITDRSIQKRYFSERSNIVYVQDWGMVAYGFVPIPSGDDLSKGDVCPFSYVEGVFLIPASGDCIGPEKLIVTADRSKGEYVCWLFGQRTPSPGWSKWDCTIERGNTLKVDRR
jgi:hypothetical protein